MSLAIHCYDTLVRKRHVYHLKRKHTRTSPGLQFKEFPLTTNGLRMDWERDLNWTTKGLGKLFTKIMCNKNIGKRVKIETKLEYMNKKTPARNCDFFSNIVFSLYHKIRVKKVSLQNHLFFAPLLVSSWPKSLLQFDFKNHENVWTDLKKGQRHHTIQTLWTVKYLNWDRGHKIN